MEMTYKEKRLIEALRRANVIPTIAMTYIKIGVKSMRDELIKAKLAEDRIENDNKTLEALKWFDKTTIRKCKRCGIKFENEDLIEDMLYCSDECYEEDQEKK